MQIVIDIPEEDYIRLKDEGMFGNVTTFKRAVREGIPLPKGHGRLIDTDVLVDGREDDYEFCEAVNATPTIIEADGGDAETWNSYHGKVTAPKGTFKRIYADADGGDAE